MKKLDAKSASEIGRVIDPFSWILVDIKNYLRILIIIFQVFVVKVASIENDRKFCEYNFWIEIHNSAQLLTNISKVVVTYYKSDSRISG